VLVSALEESDWAEKEMVAEAPSLIGPLFESVAVGATFETVTLAVYSVSSLS
jgi:hypothetical protein